MPATAEGQALTVEHDAQQAANAAATAILVRQAWQTITPEDLAASQTDWVQAVIEAIMAGRDLSEALALGYLTVFREFEAPDAPDFDFEPGPVVSVEQLVTSIRVTGPVAVSTYMGAHPEASIEEALASAETTLEGAAVRYVQNGARETIIAAVEKDPVALGYYRVLHSEKPCYFCAALASRGAVYQKESFDASDPRFIGPGEAKVHDHCGCSMEPRYSRSAEIPEQTRKYAELWTDIPSGLSGNDAMNAFRKLVEASRQ